MPTHPILSTDADDLADERFDTRRVSHRPAYIDTGAEVLGRKAPLRSCLILDTSASGARIGLKGTTAARWTNSANGLPDRFKLRLVSDGVEIDCEVMWRSENELGVRYASPARPLKAPTRPTEAPLAAQIIPGAARTFGRKRM